MSREGLNLCRMSSKGYFQFSPCGGGGYGLTGLERPVETTQHGHMPVQHPHNNLITVMSVQRQHNNLCTVMSVQQQHNSLGTVMSVQHQHNNLGTVMSVQYQHDNLSTVMSVQHQHNNLGTQCQYNISTSISAL